MQTRPTVIGRKRDGTALRDLARYLGRFGREVGRVSETGTIWVCATNHKRSHKLDKDGFEHYPSNRKVTDPDVLDFVDELIRAGGKPKQILKYLKETTGKRVILRVVHNLVQRLRAKRRGSGSVEARLKAVLRKFFANRDYSPSIFVDDSNKT
ncbi:hypothetical protein GQ600_14307 [Phytophthora cactorum]|nr:hypothetical protein GQ600_14307 [Phytophthora cactorum]